LLLIGKKNCIFTGLIYYEADGCRHMRNTTPVQIKRTRLQKETHGMKNNDAFSRPMLLWILFFSFLLFAGVVGVYCLGLSVLENVIFPIFKSDDLIAAAGATHQQLALLKSRGVMFGLPLAMILISFWSLALWVALRRTVMKKKLETEDSLQKEISKPTERQGAFGEKIIYRTDKQKEQRLFAYWLTAFQREGRLVDFFSEDLKDYDDAQIGAAVRNIQESCKKALFRHVKIKTVIDLEEGSGITLEKGFDPQAFQLVGNVRGEPPFKGIVRHRGWKISQWEIPDLSGEAKPDIVMPAEIEIR
jgi:hypothetical protein